MGKEIESKFLVKDFPENLELLGEYDVEQGYTSLNIETRIRKKVNKNTGETSYKITFKSDGDILRDEVEIPILEKDYYELKEMIEYEFITKDYKKYKLNDNLVLEVSVVDKGTSTEFMYAEIEFKTLEKQKNFEQTEYLRIDVTKDKNYKMKNYWKATRLNKK